MIPNKPTFAEIKQRYRLIREGVPETALPQKITDSDVVNMLLDRIEELESSLAYAQKEIQHEANGFGWE